MAVKLVTNQRRRKRLYSRVLNLRTFASNAGEPPGSSIKIRLRSCGVLDHLTCLTRAPSLFCLFFFPGEEKLLVRFPSSDGEKCIDVCHTHNHTHVIEKDIPILCQGLFFLASLSWDHSFWLLRHYPWYGDLSCEW